MNNARIAAVVKAAEAVTLVKVIDSVTKELYDYTCWVLDEKATLRRVALFLNGTARRHLTSDEQFLALDVLRNREA